MHQYRFWPSRLALVILGCLLGLATAELGLRVWGHYLGIDFRLFQSELSNSHRLPSAILVEDAILHHRLAPNSSGTAVSADFLLEYHINSYGQRERSVGKKQSGTPRVLALGDSFTFGEGVPIGERFTDLLQAANPQIEIFNGGVPGWGLDHLILSLREQVETLAPDLVVVFLNQVMQERLIPDFFEPGNTAPRPLKDLEQSAAPLSAATATRSKLVSETESKWTAHSWLLGYLTYWKNVYDLRKKLEPNRRADWGILGMEREGDWQNSARRTEDTQTRTSGLLSYLAKLCQEKGADLWVVNIDPQYGLGYITKIGGLRFIDLSAMLSTRAKERELRFRYDRHFNSATHKAIATALALPFAEIAGKKTRP